jgi:hypothetical protein
MEWSNTRLSGAGNEVSTVKIMQVLGYMIYFVYTPYIPQSQAEL